MTERLPSGAACLKCGYSLAGLTLGPHREIACPECGAANPVDRTRPNWARGKLLWTCGMGSGLYLLAWFGGAWLLSWVGDGFWSIPALVLAVLAVPHPAIWLINDIASRTRKATENARARTLTLCLFLSVAWIAPSAIICWQLLQRVLVIIMSAT